MYFFLYRQEEKNRRDELEKEMQRRILLQDKTSTSNVNGKYTSGRLILTRHDDNDQVSVCSCSCLDLGGKYSNHETLLPSNVMQQSSPYTHSYGLDFEALAL